MGQNNKDNPKLKIAYKVSNGSLQLRLSFAQTRLKNELQNLSQFELGRKFKEMEDSKGDLNVYNFKKYEQLYVSTGIKIKPGEWNKDTKELQNGATIFKSQLELLILQIERLYDHILKSTKKPPSVDSFRAAINEYAKNRNKIIPPHEEIVEQTRRRFVIDGKINRPVFEHMPFIDYIHAKCQIWLKHKNRQRIEAFVALLAFLKGYQEKKNNDKPILIRDLSEEFFLDFFDYITFSSEKITYRVNYLNKMFRQCRLFGFAIQNEEKYPLLVNWKNNMFPRNTEESEEVALTFQQVNQLLNFEFAPEKITYSKVRDLFVFGCFTGLRYSDLSRANVEMVNDKLCVKMTMKKTRKKVTIPLHPTAKRIWDLYKDNWFEISDTNFNIDIKEICKLVGFIHKVEVSYTNTKTKELVTDDIPFYEMVYTSTCRRTFATMLVYHFKFNPEIARRFTGHTKLSSFLRYLRINNKDAEELLASRFEADDAMDNFTT